MRAENGVIRQSLAGFPRRACRRRASRIAGLAIALAAAVHTLGCNAAAPGGLREAPPQPDPAAEEHAGPRSRGDQPTVRHLPTPGWVEVHTSIIAAANESPDAALARVLKDARRLAVEFVSGVRVRSNLLSFEQVRESDSSTLIQELITTRADAWVVEEKVLDSHREFLEGGKAYRQSLHLQARLLDRSTAADPGFTVNVEVSPARVLEGEEVTITLRSTRDARIYLLALYPGGGALILPNQSRPNTFARAHTPFVFPSDSEKKLGMRLIATLPPGLPNSAESLLVLAMRGERNHPGSYELMGMRTNAEEAGQLVSSFLFPLGDIPPDDWAFDQTSYQVFSR